MVVTHGTPLPGTGRHALTVGNFDGVHLGHRAMLERVIAQARGGFAKQGEVFVFEPTELYFGSCPVQRLPFISGYVRSKFLAAQPIPDDIRAAWMKLTNVTIEGNSLKLTMP
jgi:hypothetical protein